MNIPRLIRAFPVIIFAGLGLPAGLAEEKRSAPLHAEPSPDQAPEWGELFGGASLSVVWQGALAANQKIAAALATKSLEGVAAWAEIIHLAAHALDDQVAAGDIERAKRLKGALRQTAKIADDLLDAATRHQADETLAAHRRLSSALALARLRLPKEIVDPPPELPARAHTP